MNKIVVLFLVLIIISSLGCVGTQEEKYVGPIEEITIAETGTSPPAILIYVALEKGFFKQQGLDVRITDEYAHGQANLDAISRGEIDIATASETPVMRMGLRRYDMSLVATIGNAERHLAVVGRRDRGLYEPKDMEGKKVGVTIGSNGEFFLDLFFLTNGIPRDNIEKVHVKPTEMADYLNNGDVDAIVSWYPNWKNAEVAQGDNAITFFSEGIYIVFFNIVASNDFISNNPDIIKRTITALLKAEEYAKENPEEAIDIFAKQLNLDKKTASEVISNYDLEVSIKQAILITLEDEARWAIENNLTDATVVPNYLDYIYLDAVEDVKPEAVTIIH